MRRSVSVLLVSGLLALSGWVYSQSELSFFPGEAAATFADFGEANAVRDAIRAGLQRVTGDVDVAVADLSSDAIGLLLTRLGVGNRVRLLLGEGSVDLANERRICQDLNDLLDVRVMEDLRHRFAVVGDSGVLLTEVDWVDEAMGSGAQGVVEIDSPELNAQFRARFEALWEGADRGCP